MAGMIIFCIFGYTLILKVVISVKNRFNGIGEKRFSFGYSSSKMIWWGISVLVFFTRNFINNYRYYKKNILPDDELELFIKGYVIFVVIILIFIVLIGVKKIVIHTNGISSALGAWKWEKIKNYKWIFQGNSKDIKGIIIYVPKNLFTNWSEKIKLKVFKKEIAYVKLLIEQYIYDKEIGKSSPNCI